MEYEVVLNYFRSIFPFPQIYNVSCIYIYIYVCVCVCVCIYIYI